MNRLLRLLSGTTAILWLSGCCSGRECTLPVAGDEIHYSLHDEELQNQFDQHIVGDHPEKFDHPHVTLVLSGGGAHGPWGAGVLAGWKKSPPGRPRFDIVTGISTGALQSTFAYLGEDADDDALKLAYTTVNNKDIYEDRHWWTIPFADSLSTMEGLQNVLKKYLTTPVIDRVGEEYRRHHRLLLVGTVDMDKGRLMPWNLSKLAASDDPGRHDKYRKIVLAAASIPVFFPPVMIDGAMHVDGGVREQLFIRNVLLSISKAYHIRMLKRLDRNEKPEPAPVIYVIVNGKLGVAKKCVSDCIPEIALRSLELLLDENIIGNLYRTRYFAVQHHLEFRMRHIPQEVYANPDSRQFVQSEMLALYEKGVEWGTKVQWENHIPVFRDADILKIVEEYHARARPR